MRIIIPVLGGGLSYWLIWLAFERPETWPFLAAYIVASPLFMIGWGWAEEALGYAPAARPEEDLVAGSCRDKRSRCGVPGEDRPNLRRPSARGPLRKSMKRADARRKETAASDHPATPVPREHV